MLRNFTTLSDLKAYIPNLENLLWTDNEDYSAQIAAAEREVRDDLLNRGLRDVYLRPDLTLNAGTSAVSVSTQTDSVGETYQRARWVVNVKAVTSSVTLTLQGSNDNETFETVETITATETGVTTALIGKPFSYYRATIVPSTGSATVETYLTETIYDTLFAYKTLIIILTSMIVSENDQWATKQRYFMEQYSQLLNKAKIAYDSNQDGDIESGETASMNIVAYLK